MMTGALGLFLWELQAGTSLETARTMAVNAVVVAEMFYLLNSRYLIDSSLSLRAHLGNKYLPLGIGAVVLLHIV